MLLLLLFGTIDPIIGIVLVGVLGPLLTYVAAVKRLSGQIKDSDASELWAESRSIREWSTDRVKELNDHIAQLEARLAQVEKVNGTLAEENRKLTQKNFDLRTHINKLDGEIVSLTGELELERASVIRLKIEAENSPKRRHNDPSRSKSGD